MQAKDVMTRGVISVGPDIPVRIAAHAMVSSRVSAILVMGIDCSLMGIVSEGDLIRRVEIDTEWRHPSSPEACLSSDARAKEFVKSHGKLVRDVMTRDVVTATPDSPLREIANLMEKHDIKRVPIVQGRLVVGLVSRADLLKALADANEDTDWIESDRVLHERVIDSMKGQPWADRPFNVIVNNRRADLWGYVYSPDEKAAVRVAAESTPGIASVADHLQVAPLISIG
jgi:CBS domain-containing protein